MPTYARATSCVTTRRQRKKIHKGGEGNAGADDARRAHPRRNKSVSPRTFMPPSSPSSLGLVNRWLVSRGQRPLEHGGMG
jgi:hypothetical protein